MDQEIFYYIARCRKCLIPYAYCIDDYKNRRDTADLVAKWIRKGLLVIRLSDYDIDVENLNLHKCDCEY